MPLRTNRSTTAVRDLEEIVDYLKQESSDLAVRFVNAAEKSFDFLNHNPHVGQLCHFARPDMTEVRVWPVNGFRNHLVFYRPTNGGVEIVRVLHGAGPGIAPQSLAIGAGVIFRCLF